MRRGRDICGGEENGRGSKAPGVSEIGPGGSGSDPDRFGARPEEAGERPDEGSTREPGGDRVASGTPKKGRGSDVVVTFGEDTPPGKTGTEGASSADGTTEKDSGLIARGVDGDRP